MFVVIFLFVSFLNCLKSNLFVQFLMSTVTKNLLSLVIKIILWMMLKAGLIVFNDSTIYLVIVYPQLKKSIVDIIPV